MPFIRRLHVKCGFFDKDAVTPKRWDNVSPGTWLTNGAGNYATETTTSQTNAGLKWYRTTPQRDGLSVQFTSYVSQWLNAPVASVHWWATAASGAGYGDSYRFEINNTTVALARYSANVRTQVGTITTTQTAATTYYWLLEWSGTVLTVHKDTSEPGAPSQATQIGTITDATPLTEPTDSRYFVLRADTGATQTEVRFSGVKVFDTTDVLVPRLKFTEHYDEFIGSASFDYLKTTNIESPSAYWELGTEFEVVLYRGLVTVEDVKFWGVVDTVKEAKGRIVKVEGSSVLSDLGRYKTQRLAAAAAADYRVIVENIILEGWTRKAIGAGDVGGAGGIDVGTTTDPVWDAEYALQRIVDVCRQVAWHLRWDPSWGQLVIDGGTIPSSGLNFDLDHAKGTAGRVMNWEAVHDAKRMYNRISVARGAIGGMTMSSGAAEDTGNQDDYRLREMIIVDPRVAGSAESTAVANETLSRHLEKKYHLDIFHADHTELRVLQTVTVDSTDLTLDAVVFSCIEQEYRSGKPMRSRLVEGSTASVIRENWGSMQAIALNDRLQKQRGGFLV